MNDRSKEEKIQIEHYNDLICAAYQRGIPTFSRFAGMQELSAAFQALDAFYGNAWQEGKQVVLFGGYPEAERKILCFLPAWEGGAVPDVSEADFPICCIRIRPANRKFCEELSHRDYLGTVLGLGLSREEIGDILVTHKDGACTAYLFCRKDKSSLLTGLTRVRHTTVVAEETAYEYIGWKPELKELSGSVSSFRIDAVLASALSVSRSQALHLIQEGRFFLNGRNCTENARKMEEGDLFSVRGYGKFRLERIGAPSKKGRYRITVQQYIS